MDYFHPNHPSWVASENDALSKLKERFPDFNWNESSNVREQRLPFYPSVRFIIARNSDWQPSNAFIYVLMKGDNLLHLNGTSPLIHDLNGNGYLHLTDQTVLSYLSFFCFFVCGEKGPFYLSLTRDARYLPSCVRATEAPEHKNIQTRFGDIYQSPRQFGRNAEGHWRLSGTIYYSNAVFIGDFTVLPDGMVTLLEDNPVMADLPHSIDAPLIPEVSSKNKQPAPTQVDVES